MPIPISLCNRHNQKVGMLFVSLMTVRTWVSAGLSCHFITVEISSSVLNLYENSNRITMAFNMAKVTSFILSLVIIFPFDNIKLT